MFIQLDENKYYTGNYSSQPIVSSYEIETLPPYEDFHKQICCQYLNNKWVLDEQKFNNYIKTQQQSNIIEEIQQLQQELDNSDYKVIKCMECSLLQKELPYNINQLHKQRQQIRDSINELQLRIQK